MSTTAMTYLIDQGQDIFCHRLARIDVLGPMRRLVFTVPAVDAADSEVVVIKLIVTAELLGDIAQMAVGADREAVSAQLLALETGRAN